MDFPLNHFGSIPHVQHNIPPNLTPHSPNKNLFASEFKSCRRKTYSVNLEAVDSSLQIEYDGQALMRAEKQPGKWKSFKAS